MMNVRDLDEKMFEEDVIPHYREEIAKIKAYPPGESPLTRILKDAPNEREATLAYLDGHCIGVKRSRTAIVKYAHGASSKSCDATGTCDNCGGVEHILNVTKAVAGGYISDVPYVKVEGGKSFTHGFGGLRRAQKEYHSMVLAGRKPKGIPYAEIELIRPIPYSDRYTPYALLYPSH